jgi:nucleotide-binding universal stress UspA family protein
MEAAIAIAAHYRGEVVAVTVAEVPQGETLLAGRRLVPALEPLLESAVRYGAERGTTVRPVLKLGRRVSHAIIETAREEHCNFLVLGRPAAETWLERLVASIVERVLEAAPCQVGVVYGRIEPDAVKGIAVPVTGGANPRLAAALAPVLAERFGGPVRPFTALPPEASDAERARLEAEAREALQAAGLGADLELVRGRDAASAVARAVRPRELVVMGAPSADPVVALLGDTVPGVLAARHRNPLIVVRDVPSEGTRPFRRFFFGRRYQHHA